MPLEYDEEDGLRAHTEEEGHAAALTSKSTVGDLYGRMVGKDHAVRELPSKPPVSDASV